MSSTSTSHVRPYNLLVMLGWVISLIRSWLSAWLSTRTNKMPSGARAILPIKPVSPSLAVVTGAARGLGRQLVEALVMQGYHVIMVDIDAPEANRAAHDIRSRLPWAKLEVMELDLRDRRSIVAFAQEVATYPARPPLRVLVNNAAAIVGERRASVELGEETLAVNHLGPLYLTLLLLPSLTASPGGRVVFTGSFVHRGASAAGFARWLDEAMPTWVKGEARAPAAPPSRDYTPALQYMHTKLCNVLVARGLDLRYEPLGLRCTVLDPGVMDTCLTQDFPRFLDGFYKAVLRGAGVLRRPRDVARCLLSCIAVPDKFADKATPMWAGGARSWRVGGKSVDWGRYWFAGGRWGLPEAVPVRPSALAQDLHVAVDVLRRSMVALGLREETLPGWACNAGGGFEPVWGREVDTQGIFARGY